MQKSLTYKICIAFAVVGILLFIFAAAVDRIYIPRSQLVSDCTYETQHNDSGPICQRLHETRSMIKQVAISAIVFIFLFGTAAYMAERWRLKRG